MKEKVSDIKIKRRHRKELGDIKTLAENIKKVGLLHPVVINKDNVLIAGRRRLEAFKLLGWESIPVTVIDLGKVVDGEYAENFYRKNFLPSEINAIREALWPVEEKKAEERQKELGRTHGKDPSGNFPQGGKTRDKVGQVVGVSGKTLDKIKYVTEKAEENPEYKEFEEKMDKTGKVNGVYNEIRRKETKEKKEQEQSDATEIKPIINHESYETWLPRQSECDLLITDPPYSTDIDNVEDFAQSWLPLALSKLKSTGRAYIFIGAYPREIKAYLNIAEPQQILVWEYRNTLGPMPSYDYILNWQAILYYRNPDAHKWGDDILLDHTAVQNVGQERPGYHQWQKPTKLTEMFIQQASKEGDIILDPFAGTGTFLLMGGKLGRQAFGCDNSQEMIEIAKERGCKYEEEEKYARELA